MGFDASSPAIGAGGPPTGGAGGDLTGTYPNPTIKTSVALTTPNIGVATATTVNKVALTAPATGSTITIVDGKTFTVSTTMTLTGTGSPTIDFTGASGAPTGSGKLVMQTSPTLVTPVLGVAAGTTLDLSTVAPTVAAGHVGYGATVQATVGAAGGAAAVPATAAGYLIVNVAGTAMVIPYFAAS